MINKLIHIKTQHANKDVRERADQALSAVFHQVGAVAKVVWQSCIGSHALAFAFAVSVTHTWSETACQACSQKAGAANSLLIDCFCPLTVSSPLTE